MTAVCLRASRGLRRASNLQQRDIARCRRTPHQQSVAYSQGKGPARTRAPYRCICRVTGVRTPEPTPHPDGVSPGGTIPFTVVLEPARRRRQEYMQWGIAGL
eukprot:scaffold29290_cov153-Isochrysis_galbana.AAC.5